LAVHFSVKRYLTDLGQFYSWTLASALFAF
jgi:hypothetical protein